VVTTHLPGLIPALLDPAVFSHPVRNVRLVETHISWVILTGDYAYKIKKPVDLGFLDFSALDRRRHYCQEEVRLNRRLAPHIYLDVVPITLSAAGPVFNGQGDAVEYAVKMVQFDPDEQFDLLLERDQLRPQYLDAVAERVAAFHAGASVAGDDAGFGTPAAVCAPIEENFRQIRQYMAPGERLAAVERWSREACIRLKDTITRRRSEGYVRECHGDMHLRNIAWHEGQPLLFDCIESVSGWILTKYVGYASYTPTSCAACPR
jgi:aminoglycoside phosphotransferase family enzyme